MEKDVVKKSKISRKAWIIIGLLFLLTVISNVDKAIIGFSSVPIMKELGLSPEQWGIVGSVFFFLYSISAIIGGGLADKFGTKNVIAWMAAIWALVQFSTIFVSSFAYMLITRIILGAGEGPSYSLAMTAASKWLPKEKLGIGLTLVSIGGPFGVAISAPILMHLILNYGWRSAFIATGVFGAVWIMLWLGLSKEQPDTAVEETVVKENMVSSSESDTKFMSLLLSKNFIIIALCGFVTYWSFTIGLNWLPNYLENVRQLSEKQLTIIVSLPWILITISQVIFSSISDRIYRKTNNIVKGRVFILGSVLFTGAVMYLLGTIVNSNILAVICLSLGLTFGCITLVLGPATLADLVSKKDYGKAQGWFMALTSLGGIAGPYVTGRLVQGSADMATGFHLAFQVCSLLLCIAGVLAILAVRPKKSAVVLDYQQKKA